MRTVCILLKLALAIPIHSWLCSSVCQFAECKLSKHLNSSTCLSIAPSIAILILPEDFPIFVTFIFLLFAFISYFLTILLVSSTNYSTSASAIIAFSYARRTPCINFLPTLTPLLLHPKLSSSWPSHR